MAAIYTIKIRLLENGKVIFEGDNETIFGDRINYVKIYGFDLSGDKIQLDLEITKETKCRRKK